MSRKYKRATFIKNSNSKGVCGANSLIAFLTFLLLISPLTSKLAARTSANNSPNAAPQIAAESGSPEKYKYLTADNINDLAVKLDELGAQRYKLLFATKVPLKTFEKSYQQMALAAVLKYDGEQQFEYKHIVAYGALQTSVEMNELAEQNFEYRKTLPFAEGEKDPPNCSGDETAVILCRAGQINEIRMGSLVLMERGSGRRRAKKQYSVLTTEYKDWGRSPTAKLRELFDQTISDASYPVGLTFDRFFSRANIILEVAEDERDMPEKDNGIEYKILRQEFDGKFQREVDALLSDGYGFYLKARNFAVLIKTKNTKPTAYRVVSAEKKRYFDEISKLADQGAVFRTTDFAHDYYFMSDEYEGKLVFEQELSDDGKRFEYRIVKMTEKPTYSKNNGKQKTRAILPTTAAARAEFNRMIQDNYTPRSIFYSDGIVVLFEQQQQSR